MVQRIGGFRRKSRYKLKKGHKTKGKFSITKYFQSLKEGDNVKLLADPTFQKGMFLPRFYGKKGIVNRKKGECYEVMITDGNKDKSLIVHPVHLKREE
ncbi:MAG: 50S ribosomal protein L21e [Nanobdellota archaeon]